MLSISSRHSTGLISSRTIEAKSGGALSFADEGERLAEEHAAWRDKIKHRAASLDGA